MVDSIQHNKVEFETDTDSNAKAAARLFLSRNEKCMWRLAFAGLVSHLSKSLKDLIIFGVRLEKLTSQTNVRLVQFPLK